jgi:hypothetical protein
LRAVYVVRDAAGKVRHTGFTKRDALAPFKGVVARAQRPRRDGKPMTLKKHTLWLYLFRRGWTCTRELTPRERSAPRTTARSTARTSSRSTPTSTTVIPPRTV